MNWILLNGSPRGEKSNSTVMLNWINEGYGEENPRYQLNLTKYHEAATEAFLKADHIFLIVPLYVDSMPAQVMAFFESLQQYKEKIRGKKVIALIHSGFPEAKQSFTLKEIIQRVCNKLELRCEGVIIRGGSEPTRLMPESMQRKDAKAIKAIGQAMKEGTAIPTQSIVTLQKPIQLGPISQTWMKVQAKTGFANWYWDSQLKKNDALDRSFDKPYA